MYGLHAVGFTDRSLHRLLVYEVKHIRAIARSPVHLTKESNEALLARLNITSAKDYLTKLLRSRVKRSQDECARDVFAGNLNFLTQFATETSATQSGGLIQLPVRSHEQEVACPTCGVYFQDKHILRTLRDDRKTECIITWHFCGKLRAGAHEMGSKIAKTLKTLTTVHACPAKLKRLR